jgi:hypothetical protein
MVPLPSLAREISVLLKTRYLCLFLLNNTQRLEERIECDFLRESVVIRDKNTYLPTLIHTSTQQQ